jgi:N-acetylmuramoyl-L-alanine amidase
MTRSDQFPRVSRRAIERIYIHCTATMPHHKFDMDDVTRWHKQQGWSDNGYHGGYLRDGRFQLGRHVDRAGAHVAGDNSKTLGFVFFGGLGSDNRPAPDYTKAQIKTAQRHLKVLQEQYPGIPIIGHRDKAGVVKACPSFNVRHWVETGEMTP